jgi:hypothetical protein
VELASICERYLSAGVFLLLFGGASLGNSGPFFGIASIKTGRCLRHPARLPNTSIASAANSHTPEPLTSYLIYQHLSHQVAVDGRGGNSHDTRSSSSR